MDKYEGSIQGGKAKKSGSNVDALKKEPICALRSTGELETCTDVVTSMMNVFYIDSYALLDPGSTFSYTIPLVSKKFDICPIS